MTRESIYQYFIQTQSFHFLLRKSETKSRKKRDKKVTLSIIWGSEKEEEKEEKEEKEEGSN